MLEHTEMKLYRIKADQINKIGRHNSNHIAIHEDSISRFHTEIFYEESDNTFKIR